MRPTPRWLVLVLAEVPGWLRAMSSLPCLSLERFGARDDFDEFLGDLRLTLRLY
jgi:hypothetical protein